MKKKKERREEGEEEERRKKRLRPVVVPWRAIYRTPDFFSSFFIPSPRASRDYLVSFSPFLSLSLFFFLIFFSLSLSPSISVESRRVHALHLPSCSSFFFRTDFVHPTFSPPPSHLTAFYPRLPPLHMRVPGHSFVESFPVPPFVAALFGAWGRCGVTLTRMEEKKGGRKKERERKRAERSGITASAKSCG